MLPRKEDGRIDWQNLTQDVLCDWIRDEAGLNPEAELKEQAALYAYISATLSTMEAKSATLALQIEKAQEAQSLEIRLVRDEQEELIAIALAEAYDRILPALAAKLGKSPAAIAVDTEAKRDLQYLEICRAARKARRDSLTNPELEELQLQKIELDRMKAELDGILKALYHRKEGLVNDAYNLRQERKQSRYGD